MLFDRGFPEGFIDGRWAKGMWEALGQLRERLNETRDIAPGLECTHRVWRGPFFNQWVQYEPKDYRGPAFRIGKPAVVAGRSLDASHPALYAGYYIERGLPPGTPGRIYREQIMEDNDPTWDWTRFYKTLSDESAGIVAANGQAKLSGVLRSLPTDRRCIWISDSTAKAVTTQTGDTIIAPGICHALGELSELSKVKDDIGKIKRTHWIDLIVGVRYSMEECMERQEGLIDGIVCSLKQAYLLYTFFHASGS